MAKLILGAAFILAGALMMVIAGVAKSQGGARPAAGIVRTFSLVLAVIGGGVVLGSMIVVIGAGQVGVRHAFGRVDPVPLVSGIRFVTPWSYVERFSTREEQYPEADEAEQVFHFMLGRRRQTRTVRFARDILVDVDGSNHLAGLWLLNVPPFPAQA